MHSTTAVLALLAAVPAVLGHAGITSPPIRQPGNAFLSQCGQASFNSVKGDQTGHIEELTLCRGMLFKDQPASNVQTVTPGQQMTMGVDCTIPHGGPANVSVVDTTVGGAGAFVGSFLKTFDDFCPTSGQTPADQTNMQFNLPSADVIGDKCKNAGDCVVQLFWATPDFSQNYYYCVDIQMNNAAAASTSAPAVSSSSAAVATSSAAAVSNSSAVVSTSSVVSSTVAASSSSASVVSVVSSTSAAVVSTEAATTTEAVATTEAPAVTPAVAAAESSSSGFVIVHQTVTVAPAVAQSAVAGALTSGAQRGLRFLWFRL